jgi:hypothetical protein
MSQTRTYRAALGHLNRLSEVLDIAGYVRRAHSDGSSVGVWGGVTYPGILTVFAAVVVLAGAFAVGSSSQRSLAKSNVPWRLLPSRNPRFSCPSWPRG